MISICMHGSHFMYEEGCSATLTNASKLACMHAACMQASLHASKLPSMQGPIDYNKHHKTQYSATPTVSVAVSLLIFHITFDANSDITIDINIGINIRISIGILLRFRFEYQKGCPRRCNVRPYIY